MRLFYSTKARTAIVAGASLMLAACGGGSTSSDPLSVTPTPDPQPTTPVVDPNLPKYALSGTVSITAAAAADSDTADPANQISNNTFDEAQRIDNPVALAGYVSSSSGVYVYNPEWSYVRDLTDMYQVTLVAGQTVTLRMVEGVGISAPSLRIYNASRSLISSRVGNAKTKTLSVTADGTYYISVNAGGPAESYQLEISSPLESANAEFVAGEIIVEFSPIATAASGDRQVQATTVTDRLAGQGIFRKAQQANSEHSAIYRVEQFVSDSASVVSGLRTTASAEQDERQKTLKALAWVQQQPGVARAHLNYIRHAQLTPNDPYYSRQWHYPLINLPDAWDTVAATDMSEVVVAVIDTGVRFNHEDLQQAMLSGYDFVDNDSDASDPGDVSNGSPVYHGVHVAGTIAAKTGNGVGVAGVGGLADSQNENWLKILPLRVLDSEGSGFDSDISRAIRVAAGDPSDAVQLSKKAHIINLSLGGPGDCGNLQSAINYARSQGVIVVAAAGNENSTEKSYPAACDGVISVSAVASDKTRAEYSNYAASLSDNWIDLAAPGGDFRFNLDGDVYPDGIWSTWREGNQYKNLQGTSMATPHVAGVLALMKGLKTDLTPAQVDSMISDGLLTTDIGDAGVDRFFGYGLIDAYKAVLVSSDQSVPALILTSVPSLNFLTSETNHTFSISNGGDEALTISGVTSTKSWLTVAATSTDSAGIGTYTATVNRDGLSGGVHLARIQVASPEATTKEISVIMYIASTNAFADLGRHYLILTDENDNAISGANLDASNGQYSFALSEIPQGTYYLLAGTDINNDGFICDDGEFCARYPLFQNPKPIELTSDTSGVDMLTTYVFSDFESTSVDTDASSTSAKESGIRR